MADEVYIYRVKEDFSEQWAISIHEWENCVQNISNLKINDINESIDTKVEELNGWYPVFELSGSIKERPFFEFEEIYDKAIEIAEYLDCVIQNQEGNLIYYST